MESYFHVQKRSGWQSVRENSLTLWTRARVSVQEGWPFRRSEQPSNPPPPPSPRSVPRLLCILHSFLFCVYSKPQHWWIDTTLVVQNRQLERGVPAYRGALFIGVSPGNIPKLRTMFCELFLSPRTEGTVGFLPEIYRQDLLSGPTDTSLNKCGMC